MRLVAFFVLFLSCFPVFSAETKANLTLVYTGNLDGELEPCGCSEGGNKGGLKRQATIIDQLRQQFPDLIFVSSGGFLVSEMPQDKIKSDFILKGLTLLNYDATGVQWRDLAFGTDYLQKTELPFIASNWNNGQFAKSKVIARKDASVAFFAWLDPNEDPAKAMSTEQRIVVRDNKALLDALANAKRDNQTTILATTLAFAQAKKLFALDNVDLLIIKSKYELFGEPRLEGKTLVLEPGSRGMRFGQLQLTLDDDRRVAYWKHEVIALPPEVADSPRMETWYVEYNAQLKEDYEKRVEQRKLLMTDKTPYATVEKCAQCHVKEHETWSKTAHSEAFFKLQDVNKSFDPFCIGCHTLGYEKDGGYIDTMLTPKLMHVQCENCHGASRAHAENPTQVKTSNHDWKSEQRCAQCHVQKHSPDFKFNQYWPKIAHGTPR